MPDDDFDAYATLRVTPNAEDFILEAAYRAMARQFHPDGPKPDAARMAEINRAYDQVRTPERRKRYDRLHHLRPVGPGETAGAPSMAAQALGGHIPPPTNGSSSPGSGTPGVGVLMTIDFGRYKGWTLKDLAKYDPDYLRFLSRHSSGVRYRSQIAQLLPDETEATQSRRGKY
jgi:curved DNA-binding protein CbpA